MEEPLRSRFILQTPRLLLRTLIPADAPFMARLANNPAVARNLRDRFPSPYSLADAEQFISRHSGLHPAVCGAVCLRPGVFLHPRRAAAPEATAAAEQERDRDPATAPWTPYELTHGRFIGMVSLIRLADCESRSLELGYWFGQPFWGRGYASEVVPAYARWGFDEFPDVRRLESGAFSENPASLRVLMKSGFVLEGTRREAIVKGDGRVMDCYVLGLLRREMEEKLERLEAVRVVEKREGYVWEEASRNDGQDVTEEAERVHVGGEEELVNGARQ